MCQFLCCDCWWCNWCGVCCGGLHYAICICSCWVCKPLSLELVSPLCCHICDCDGWGYNACCWGHVCCAPVSLRVWSKMHAWSSIIYLMCQYFILRKAKQTDEEEFPTFFMIFKNFTNSFLLTFFKENKHYFNQKYPILHQLAYSCTIHTLI